MKSRQPQVIFEDNHCLVVNKPAGWLTMGDRTGEISLCDWCRDYLREKYQKPGAVFLGVVHRLDRPVSGVVLLARTSKAASRLCAQFRERTVSKCYWAVVEGTPPLQGVLEDLLVKDRRQNRVRVRGTTGQVARLTFRRVANDGKFSLLAIELITGRSHQIRVQLGSRHWPIVGDHKYGSRIAFQPGELALHARELGWGHPTRPEWICVRAPVPVRWRQFSFVSKWVTEEPEVSIRPSAG
ncbi:MAG: RNA pseudouridine synthase [Planctomycetaceae bacterium]|nr:MAG: RNA pseudouridine synthase [Planctomycetaceae bacterium]